MIAEPGSDLIWNTAYLGAHVPPSVSLTLQRWEYASGGWRVAPSDEVRKLMSGWHGANWALWLDTQTGEDRVTETRVCRAIGGAAVRRRVDVHDHVVREMATGRGN